jgi:hypothetical protein
LFDDSMRSGRSRRPFGTLTKGYHNVKRLRM